MLEKLSIASVGLASSLVVATPDLDLGAIVEVVVQIVIGVGTLIGLFRKKKKA